MTDSSPPVSSCTDGLSGGSCSENKKNMIQELQGHQKSQCSHLCVFLDHFFHHFILANHYRYRVYSTSHCAPYRTHFSNLRVDGILVCA